MHIHRIDTFLITENVRVEIVYESNPYFAGDPIVAVIRLRHLGSKQELESLIKKQEDLTIRPNSESGQNNNNDDKSSTSHRRTRSTHSNISDHQSLTSHSITDVQEEEEQQQSWGKVRSIFNAFRGSLDAGYNRPVNLDETLKKERQLKRLMKYHQPVTLLSGFIQVSGMFQYDSTVIDRNKLKKLNTKIVGLDSLNSNILPLNNNSINYTSSFFKAPQLASEINAQDLSRYLTSDYDSVTSGFYKSNNSQSMIIDGNDVAFVLSSPNSEYNIQQIPTLLIPQTLLFTELTLEAGELKVFRFKTDSLPVDICPTYTKSQSLSISYSLDFGVTKLSNDDMEKFQVKVPISIGPFVNNKGKEYTCIIDREPLIMEPGYIKNIKSPQVQRKVSIASTISSVPAARRNSFLVNAREANDNLERLKTNFIKLVESNKDNSHHIEELVDKQIELQFGSLDSFEDDSEGDLNGTNFQSKRKKKKNTVRDNISNISVTLGDGTITTQEGNNFKDKLIPQLNDLQRMYKINNNGMSIATLKLAKEFYNNSEDVDLILELNPEFAENNRISAATAALEIIEALNPKFVMDGYQKNSNNQVTHIADSHALSFDKCTTIPFKLILPRTPMNQISSQFSSDIFQVKMMISLRFIIITNNSETPIIFKNFEDKNGILYHSSDSLEGDEFSCRVPLPFLPSDHAFGGW
ncbi:hypothetical protein TBLA_0H01320 [Henningerozyma blattae CBS 6284]|uniref:Rgp1-domain-containing protein n=1 Tax=Henningerozyma blattae (strain ATCC 34711 / CBS 6284 / DSM 70876 / NBRC 10599 / NRRL Y-10934 / UCD 77-7) TaxID=1071380 RepID=I2H7R7_HENB6|nr:hypothetical protein TBLA_0H01320 [Tetrapisispora blattae CBS 6284]CCH62419.1 hypothetical protein TBLA_0H01320 [Tetrapisispora blattae CBS 6284]